MIMFLMMIHSQRFMMLHQNMFYKEMFKSVKLDDDNRQPSGTKSDSENMHHKPRSSKFQSFNKIL